MKKQLFLASVCLGLAAFPSFSYKVDALLYPVPEAFLPDFTEQKLNPRVESQVVLDSKGTTLHVPKDAFVDLDGKVVEDAVSIQYKQYNNAADMAFSKIPMTYQGNNFNSSGMFEIQGKCNGKPIRIAPGKSLTIDYHLAKKNPNTDFYRLNENTQQWVLVADIPEMADKADVAVAAPKVDEPDFDNNDDIINQRTVNLNANPWNGPKPAVNNDLNIRGRNWNANRNLDRNDMTVEDNGNRTANTLLAENADAGHTYPAIVKGLNVESFGVYNCDQIYRVPNRIDVTASFKDEKGNPINNLHVLSLIDLNYNGAFSFNPTQFTCDAKGNNVVLLFSTSNELYLLDKGEFAKMGIDKSGSYTFTVKNVSNSIRSTADLAKHLGISI